MYRCPLLNSNGTTIWGLTGFNSSTPTHRFIFHTHPMETKCFLHNQKGFKATSTDLTKW